MQGVWTIFAFLKAYCMPPLPRSLSVRPLRWLAGFVAVTAILFFSARALIPPDHLCPDFICFWSAGKLMASGQSPYDPVLEAEVQHAFGWDKAKNGFGIYDCLPYYYPPWFGMLFVPLLPLGFSGAKIAWLVLNVELLFLTGILLRYTFPDIPRSIPIIVVVGSSFSFVSVKLGQTPPLIIFLIAVACRLLEKRRDWLAGSVLAWLTIKPQLTGVFLLAVLVWMGRQHRWGLLRGFAATLGLLAIMSTLVLPDWPIQMLRAPGRIPLPTHYFPWVGSTWLLVLKTLLLPSWWVVGLYLIVALPLLVAVMRQAFDRDSSLKDVMSLSLLAAFFVAPYGQVYDYTVLLFPLFVLLGDRISDRLGAFLLFSIMFLPYVHMLSLDRLKLWWVPAPPTHQVTMFWIPLLLLGVWLASGLRVGGRQARPVLI
jgi:hypothetical protein